MLHSTSTSSLRNISISKHWTKTNGTWRGKRHWSLDCQNRDYRDGRSCVHTSRALLVKVARACAVWGSRLTAPQYSRQESREGVKKVRNERKDQEIFTRLAEKGRDNWAKWRADSCRHSSFDTRRPEKLVKRRLRSRASSERKVVCHCSLCRLFSGEYQIEGSPSTLSEFLGRKGEDREVRSFWRVLESWEQKDSRGTVGSPYFVEPELLRTALRKTAREIQRTARKTNGNFAD